MPRKMPEWPIPTLGNGLRKGSPLASWSNRGWTMRAFLPYRKSGRPFPGRKMRGAADTVLIGTGRRNHSGRIGTTHGNAERRTPNAKRQTLPTFPCVPGASISSWLSDRFELMSLARWSKSLFNKHNVFSIPFQQSRLARQFIPHWYSVPFAYGGAFIPLFLRNRLVPDCALLCHALCLRLFHHPRLSSALFSSHLQGSLACPAFYRGFRCWSV